jgi:hypothetical protein
VNRLRRAGGPLGLAAAACAACCVGPLVGALGLGTVTAGALAAWGSGLAVALVAGSATFVAVRWRARRAHARRQARPAPQPVRITSRP